MPVFDRNKGQSGLPPNLWIRYRITEELRVKHGLSRCEAREPAPDNRRAAAALEAQRRREVRDGTWRPAVDGGARGSKLRVDVAEWIEARRSAGVRGARDEEQRLRDYVLPVLGDRPTGEIRRVEVKALVASIATRISERTGRPLAPRTQRHAYNDLRTFYADMVADEKVVASPCTLRQKRGELPQKKDANPRWRAGAIYTREEAELLMSDERVPTHRRVLYALIFFGAMRIGEAVARRWRDYDTTAKPLGRLSIETQHDDDELKTEDPRDMPVHPTLAKILAAWKAHDFELVYCRAPTPDDYLVPNRVKGKRGKLPFISGKRAWANLQTDLDALGLRRRRVHDTRRTFISSAIADGADKYLLKFATHGRPKKDAFDEYMTPPWDSLCQQVACLDLPVRGFEKAKVLPLQPGSKKRTVRRTVG